MVAMVNSKQKQLKPDAILAIAMKNLDADIPFRNAYLAFVAEAATKGAKFYQYGNTTFITHDIGDRRCLFTSRNADTAQNFVENGAKFIKQVYKDGYDIAIVQYDDPSISNIIKAISRKMPKDTMGYSIYKGKKNNTKYMAIIKCGPYRKGGK